MNLINIVNQNAQHLEPFERKMNSLKRAARIALLVSLVISVPLFYVGHKKYVASQQISRKEQIIESTTEKLGGFGNKLDDLGHKDDGSTNWFGGLLDKLNVDTDKLACNDLKDGDERGKYCSAVEKLSVSDEIEARRNPWNYLPYYIGGTFALVVGFAIAIALRLMAWRGKTLGDMMGKAIKRAQKQVAKIAPEKAAELAEPLAQVKITTEDAEKLREAIQDASPASPEAAAILEKLIDSLKQDQ